MAFELGHCESWLAVCPGGGGQGVSTQEGKYGHELQAKKSEISIIHLPLVYWLEESVADAMLPILTFISCLS